MSKPFASLLDLNSKFSLLFFFSFLPSISSSLLIYGLIIESFADPSFLIFREGYSSFLLLFTDSFTSSLYLLCSSSSISSRRNSSFHVPLFSLSLSLLFNRIVKEIKKKFAPSLSLYLPSSSFSLPSYLSPFVFDSKRNSIFILHCIRSFSLSFPNSPFPLLPIRI